MLFTEPLFLFVFLPVVIFIFVYIKENNLSRMYMPLIIMSSLVFYGMWNWHYLFLLFLSILFNFQIAKSMLRPDSGKSKLVLGLVLNLLLLGYYKYVGFFSETLSFFSINVSWEIPILPLAISFFTFQQIAFLVDVYKNKISNFNMVEYSAFVLFFPQLIAGPIVNYREIQPQFHLLIQNKLKPMFGVGVFYLLIGLIKKLAIADPLGVIVNPIFSQVDVGQSINPIEAVVAWLGYTFQLYFDFSAYGDMAIGMGLFFGVRLPINFNSPYKSYNIIEFWRSWHITLGAFLKNYLYIPLGGGRCKFSRKNINLLTTMVIGGLWHGASWTFVLWGALHGFMLVLTHIVKHLLFNFNIRIPDSFKGLGVIPTFLFVSLAWIFFKTTTLDGAIRLIGQLVHITDINNQMLLENERTGLFSVLEAIKYLLLGFVVTFLFPNSHQIIAKLQQLGSRHQLMLLRVFNYPISSFVIGFVFFIISKELMTIPSVEFLYFNF
jgi:D-alanyl-lipoteichoic acid acyltransferase DltB (MBOAT superfamily)